LFLGALTKEMLEMQNPPALSAEEEDALLRITKPKASSQNFPKAHSAPWRSFGDASKASYLSFEAMRLA
jgi:hypothetical protein